MHKRKVTTLSAPDGKVIGQLIELGGMLFSSSITGIDPDTGRLSAEPSEQVATAFANLGRLLDQAGARTDALGMVTVCISDHDHAPHIEKPWAELFPDETNRPACKINEYQLPEGELVQIQTVGASGENRQPIEVSGFSDPPMRGAALGRLVFSSPIDGTDPSTGRRSDDRKSQMRQAFRNMESFVQQAGGSKEDLIHVFIFVRSKDDQNDMLDAWLEAFPVDGDRPARKAIFDETLERDSKVIHLLCVAVLGGGKRVNLEVPGISKRHPNPMGCKIDNLVFSSGVGGDDPNGNTEGQDPAIRASLALENMHTLLEAAGGGLADVGIVSITVNGYADEDAILQQWRQVFPDPTDAPARHVMAFGGRGSYPVQLHIMGVLEQA
jgi:2-iminobutanoate/2-iminopropanoate deaminase